MECRPTLRKVFGLPFPEGQHLPKSYQLNIGLIFRGRFLS